MCAQCQQSAHSVSKVLVVVCSGEVSVRVLSSREKSATPLILWHPVISQVQPSRQLCWSSSLWSSAPSLSSSPSSSWSSASWSSPWWSDHIQWCSWGFFFAVGDSLRNHSPNKSMKYSFRIWQIQFTETEKYGQHPSHQVSSTSPTVWPAEDKSLHRCRAPPHSTNFKWIVVDSILATAPCQDVGKQERANHRLWLLWRNSWFANPQILFPAPTNPVYFGRKSVGTWPAPGNLLMPAKIWLLTVVRLPVPEAATVTIRRNILLESDKYSLQKQRNTISNLLMPSKIWPSSDRPCEAATVTKSGFNLWICFAGISLLFVQMREIQKTG